MSASPLREQFPSLVGEHFEVWISEGWLQLATETLQLLLQEQAKKPALRVDQIKQKWGTLAINGEKFSKRADAIVREAEQKSKSICEVCGKPGGPVTKERGTPFVVGVRCEEHFSIRTQVLVPDVSNEQARKGDSNTHLREQFPTLFAEDARIDINLDYIEMGWVKPVTKMLKLLLKEQANAPAMRITQIKKKYGCLCVYGDYLSERADEIVAEAEEKTATTCDVCGEPGVPDKNSNGMTTGVRCADHIRKYEIENARLPVALIEAKVGIFFVVNGDLLFDAVPLEQGEPYGDTVGFSAHVDYWEALAPKTPTEQLFKSHPYDYYPRGRVVYFKDENVFRLYADRCITMDEKFNIAMIFQLPSGQVARRKDEHYQCAKCNSGYVDI